jgi:RND family efflux transporter MFP subunit
MLRSGIFQLKLKAPQAGTYKCRLEVTGPQIEDVIEGFEIVVHPNAQTAKKASEGDDTGGAEPISFLKEQQWKIPFATAFSVDGAVAPTVEVAGEVSTPPAGQAEVGAAISGRLVAPPKGIPKPGQGVKKGELLATIAPAPAAPEDGARATLAVVEAKARREAAQAAFERAERLIADQAISQREVDDAKRELGVAEEAVKASERARAIFAGSASGSGAGSYRVTSPIDGIVVDVEATTGQSLRGGDLLFRVVNLEEVWLLGKVPEQEAARIVAEQDAAFKLQGLEEWLPLRVTGDDTNASVVNVGKVVDKRSRTVEIIYGLNEPDKRLRIGALISVAVPVGESWKGVVVTRGAVLDDDGSSVVYVQTEGEAFEERSVRLGPVSGAYIGIQSGVSAGERVVTLGANVVRLSSRAGSAPAHGHVH